VGDELGRVFRRFNRAVSAALRPHGLSSVHADILITLWHRGPMTMGELQKHMALSSSTSTGAIDRMERANLVRRDPSPSDRRSFVVEPVAWETQRRHAVMDALIAAEDAFFGALDAGERVQLLQLLRKIQTGGA
jgi:DNA-binding MarR family transcriptional regulator